MTREQYMAQRQNLMKQANTALAGGDAEAANGFADQVKELDNKWEAIATAEANLNALNDSAPTLLNFAGGATATNLTPIQQTNLNQTPENDEPVNAEDPAYKHAWAKSMMGFALNSTERTVFNKTNERLNDGTEFTHTVGNTATLIPNTVVAGIWKIAEEQYPLFADFRKFNITGKMTTNKHDGIISGDAQWVDESDQAEDENNKFGQLVLDGFELNKVATVSWKMKSMTESEFVAFITQELGDRLGAAVGIAAHQGTGVKQPKGVEVLLAEEDGTPQVVTYTDQVKYTDLTAAMAKIHSSFAARAAVYVNNATLWNQVANIVDGIGRPIFVPDPTGSTIGRILGREVKVDAGAKDGDILIGDAQDTAQANTNQPMSLAQEDHVKGRKTDYGAYSVLDFGLLTTKGFALLTPAPKA